jgi:hypothetical protein
VRLVTLGKEFGLPQGLEEPGQQAGSQIGETRLAKNNSPREKIDHAFEAAPLSRCGLQAPPALA